MRYHYEKPKHYIPIYGVKHRCNHPLYKYCTLYLIGYQGVAVVQKRFDPVRKIFWYSEVDPWLANDIYVSPRFLSWFKKNCGACKDGLYPTFELRRLMWALRMKPLPKEWWESQI